MVKHMLSLMLFSLNFYLKLVHERNTHAVFLYMFHLCSDFIKNVQKLDGFSAPFLLASITSLPL